MKNLRSFPVSLCSLRSSLSVGTGRNTRATHTVYVVVFLGLGRENKGDNVREERMRPAGLSGRYNLKA